MNLTEMNLVELNAQEAVEIEGGIWPLVIVACLLLGGCAAQQVPVYDTNP